MDWLPGIDCDCVDWCSATTCDDCVCLCPLEAFLIKKEISMIINGKIVKKRLYEYKWQNCKNEIVLHYTIHEIMFYTYTAI